MEVTKSLKGIRITYILVTFQIIQGYCSFMYNMTKTTSILPVAGCTMLAAAPNARFLCSVFGKDPPTGI